MREVKFPYYIFDIVNKKCSPMSLIGTEANLVTADRDEFGPSVITNLFDGVSTKSEKIIFSPQKDCLVVLKQLFPHLFGNGFISRYEIAELWRKSICCMFQLLRDLKKFESLIESALISGSKFIFKYLAVFSSFSYRRRYYTL